MGSIHKIEDYEKIAAGEVIERPASVVKELLENAIDAGADRIEIHAEQAGIKSIKVIDNGKGIAPDEVVLAFERHTTSKISGFDDIYKLVTLGFRGEALASIKAVARVEVVTRPRDRDVGRRVVFEGDAIVDQGDVACPAGTTILVKNLFYNVPVRRKFLKKEAVEFSHMSDIVTRYALAYHDRDIKLYHDGRKVIDAPASEGDLLNTIVSLYGAEHATAMIPVSRQAPSFSLRGYVAKPEITRSSRAYSSLFVNGRAVHSTDVARAIEDAYHGRLMKGRYPFHVLFLDIDPSLVDVNIHPSKKEIKFSNEDDLLGSIQEWIEDALETHVKKLHVDPPGANASLDDLALVPAPGVIDCAMDHAVSAMAPASPDRKQPRCARQTFDELVAAAMDRVPAGLLDDDAAFDEGLDVPAGGGSKQSRASAHGTTGGAGPAREGGARLGGWVPLDGGPAGGAALEHVVEGSFTALPPATTLWKGMQLGNAFLLFQTGNGDLLVVDQHAASERVEYEKLLARKKTAGIQAQQVLVPKRLSLPPALIPLLEGSLDALRRHGFDFVTEDEDGVTVFKVTRYPQVFHRRIEARVIEDFLEDLLSADGKPRDKPVDSSRDDVLQVVACHAAIRSGDPLEPRQAWALLRDLDKCAEPGHCCHGRPTYHVLPFSFFEKTFKRVV